MISDSVIADANFDIVGVIERYGIKLKKKGTTYTALCPFHSEKSPSFTVDDKKKFYMCFGCGASGDAVGFVRAYENLPFRDAVEKITGQLPPDFKAAQARESYKKEEAAEWLLVVPVPSDALLPPDTRFLVAPDDFELPKNIYSFVGGGGDVLVKHFADNRYAYKDAAGDLIGYIVRFNCAWGGKDVIPQSWCKNTKTGEYQWRWLSFAKPRPIYGLERLAANPSAQVIMVEGEKACDAAKLLIADTGIPEQKLVVLAWAGGGKAVKHTDWSPLAGRSVGLWPDADQKCFKDSDEVIPFIQQIGTTVMLDIAERIKDSAKSIKIIVPPDGVPCGWDLADEPPVGFDVIQHLKSNSMLVDDFIARFAVPCDEEDDIPWVDVEPIAPEPLPMASEEHKDILLNNGYFTILGYDGNNYFFFHHFKMQILSRTAANFNDIGLMELAPINWWEEMFPGEKGYNKKSAVTWLFHVANSRGVYNPSNVRGRGAWIDNGRLIYHHGNKLSVDGMSVKINELKSGFVYPLARSSLQPSKSPMTNEEGMKLCHIATLPRWCMAGSAALMSGWVMLAPICGALNWRPHVWMAGPAGSGKTTIQKLYCGALTKGVHVYANGNSTEAGIRQELKGDALPVLVDEFESNNERDKVRVESVMNLIRQTSSETQAQTLKGTIGGSGLRYDVRSMFCLSSINTNLPTKADVDRLTILSLKAPSNKGVDNWKVLEARLNEIDQDNEISARLLGRALKLMPVILEAVKVFRRVAAVKFGAQRDGDQYGTLLAGCWCLAHDYVPNDDMAMALINKYDWSVHREDSEQDDAARALEAILAARLRVGTIGEFSVFELVRECSPIHRRDLVDATLADTTLRRYGIRAEFSSGGLWFGTGVTPLRHLVDKMSFVTDLRGQLLRVKGAERLVGSRKFNGMDSKVVSVPIYPILEGDAADLNSASDEII